MTEIELLEQIASHLSGIRWCSIIATGALINIMYHIWKKDK